MKYNLFIFILISLSLISTINAIDSERKDRLDFGYVLEIKNVSTEPLNLAPGQTGILKIQLKNNAKFQIYDIRTQLNLPSQISLFEDISKRKIAKMESGETRELTYNLITLPTSTEGIYSASINIIYLNHVATEREENDSFGMIVRYPPKIYAEIEKTDIYRKNSLTKFFNKDPITGTITITFINNDISNIKFLNVELGESLDYEILSSNRKYIGDLDSDDFQSVDFRLKILKEIENVDIPLKISYKDSFNKEYLQDINLILKIISVEENGKKKTSSYLTIGIIIIAVIIIFYLYKKRKKKEGRKS